MSGHPRVSVIVCVHNGEKFLEATMQSLLGQTYTGFEAIVVDDGSTDGSAAVLERYHDPRVHVIHQKNGGAAAALCTGLSESSGEYVAFLDQDDVWDPNSLAVHIDFLDRHSHVQLSFSWFRVIDENGAEIGVQSQRHRGPAEFSLLLEDFVVGGTSNFVVRREAIVRAGGIDPNLPRAYDLDLCLRTALLSPGAVEAIPRDLMYYRRHPSQMTRTVDGLPEEWERVIQKIRVIAPGEVAKVEKRARSNMSRYYASLAFEQAEYRRGLTFLGRGFHHAPIVFLSDFRNWQTLAACLAGLLLPDRLLQTLESAAGLKRPRPLPKRRTIKRA